MGIFMSQHHCWYSIEFNRQDINGMLKSLQGKDVLSKSMRLELLLSGSVQSILFLNTSSYL